MRYVLIGKRNKRYEFFAKACLEKNIKLEFFDIEDENLISRLQEGDVIKIDPIANDSIYIEDLKNNIITYKGILDNLSDLKNVSFMNFPKDIYKTLDKKACKKILMQNRIKSTPMLDFNGKSLEELTDYMNENKLMNIFIKHNFGSGASGVIAFKYNKNLDRYIAYTSILKKDNFINTKKIRKFTDKKKIREIVNFILSDDFIVEKWIAKDDISGINYDLRVIYQFNQIDFIQVRGCKENAITNLHLNNMPLNFEDLQISDKTMNEVENLCKKSINSFSNLKSVGFDILIEKNTKRPYIIEMNSQGDLMYKDIYFENKIYKRQVEKMENKWQD